jgi:hypothetical protein
MRAARRAVATKTISRMTPPIRKSLVIVRNPFVSG